MPCIQDIPVPPRSGLAVYTEEVNSIRSKNLECKE